MKSIILTLALLATLFSFGQAPEKTKFNKEYANVPVGKLKNAYYFLSLEKGEIYEVSVLQQGIDVKLVFTTGNSKLILEKDSPNGTNGYEKFEYSPTVSGTYHLWVYRVLEDGNPDNGTVSVLIKKLSKKEVQQRNKIKELLAPENSKTVLTLDIDHFWGAFDKLKNCKTRKDSINTFQTGYLDIGTDGLKDFIEARQFTAEKFVNAVARYPKFYASVRQNTYEVKNAVVLVEEIVSKFQQYYPNFVPHKVCFAIGIVNTGGTVSDKFLLIGTEISTATKYTDVSEFKNSSFSKQIATGEDIIQKLKNIVAHEYVHTQQTTPLSKDAVSCELLYRAMREGFCDFIGELTSGSQINLIQKEYGDKNEKQIWLDFKSELCNTSSKNWLYNYSTVKDKPADLGYYVGYKIAEEYYRIANDKNQAITDIIEMNDPIEFLQLSQYDQKPKN